MKESYHFIGIGGAGMSALARILAAQGVHVSGSDMAESATLCALRGEYGIDARAGHDRANLNGATRVIVSAAVNEENPEIAAARERGIPVISRAQMLGELMDRYAVRIAVSGTHGKTTTSAMVAQMLAHAGLDPTALIGGEVPAWRANARLGESDIFVAESCEAYASFLDLHPTISIVTNIEADHLDHYGNIEAILTAFAQFLSQTRDLAVLCADDPHCLELQENVKTRALTYGFSEAADLRAKVVSEGLSGYRYAVFYQGKALGEMRLNVPGRHNAVNALAALAVGLELGVPFAQAAAGLAQFRGTGRRFERVGETARDVLVIDDYAHHPTEIKATLAAARSAYPDRRIVAVFQPHLPSRTRDFLDEFARAFGDADLIFLTDIYLAREKPMPGMSGELLARRVSRVRGRGQVRFIGDKDNLSAVLAQEAKPGDLVLTLGAGDIYKAGARYLEACR